MIQVGPVVGKVTGDTARLLIEIDADREITCTVQPHNAAEAAAPITVKKAFKSHRPDIFCINGLIPDTQYRATFDVTFPGGFQDYAQFRTNPVPWSLSRRPPKIAVLSCNKIFTTHKDVTDPGDLWADLARKAKEGKVDYVCHIGDNVYADSDLYLIEAGKKEYQGGGDCKFLEAREKIAKLPRDQWETQYEAMCETFRSIYRLTWGHHATQHALANVPNIMILDDHDIRDDWGDEPDHYDPQAIDRYVGLIGFQVYNEYQRRLYEDFTSPQSIGPDQPQYLESLQQSPDHSFHSHVFDDLAILFIDVRAAKSFHFDKPNDSSFPFLGHKQWTHLRQDFSSTGKFSKVRFLLVLVPVPIAYLSKRVTELGSKGVNDLRGAWTYQSHCAETREFMKTLNDWRNGEAPGQRNLLIVGGDVHEGGMTEIHIPKNLRGVSKAQPKYFVQMTSSAVANSILPWHQSVVPSMARHMSYKIPGGYTMRHMKWTHDRNYGTCKALLDPNGKVDFITQLISSDGKKIEHHDEMSQSQDFGKMAKCCGLG